MLSRVFNYSQKEQHNLNREIFRLNHKKTNLLNSIHDKDVKFTNMDSHNATVAADAKTVIAFKPLFLQHSKSGSFLI